MQKDILYHIALHSDLRTITSLIVAHRHHTLDNYFWKSKYDFDKLLRESDDISKLYKMTMKEKYMKAVLLSKEIDRLLNFETYSIEIGNINRIKHYFHQHILTSENYQLKLSKGHIILHHKIIQGEYSYYIETPKDIKMLLFNVLY